MAWDTCQFVRPEYWDRITQINHSGSENHIQNVDPDLMAVDLYDYDKRDTAYENRGGCAPETDPGIDGVSHRPRSSSFVDSQGKGNFLDLTIVCPTE